nr:uncharacterized protein LOC129382568 [Dermacentor andersoni]
MAFKFPHFIGDTDKWHVYPVKVDAYFEANEVTDDAKKRALLVAAVGSRTLEILCGRAATRKPSSLSYEEVVATLNEHYDPSPNEISESFKFFHQSQQEGESMQTFVVEIRRIAHNCNFSSMLQGMLRDRIVCGVRSKNLQKELLAKKDLTLVEAEALALAAESAELGSQQMYSQGDAKLEIKGVPLLYITSQSAEVKQQSQGAAPVMEKFADLFTEGLGLFKGPPARLHIKDGAIPRFCKDKTDQEDEAQIVLTPDQWDQPAVPLKELKALAVADEVLSQVRNYTREGWLRRFYMETKEIAEFYKKRHELSVAEEVLNWGNRLVVPKDARGKLLKLLHAAHQGVSKLGLEHDIRAGPAKAANDSSCNFASGDYVYVRNYGVGDKWSPGTVEATSGTCLLDVKSADGLVRR